VKLKTDEDDEDNHKETYINANFINVYNIHRFKAYKWKRKNDNSYLGTIIIDIKSFLEDDSLRKCEYGDNAL